MKKFTLTLCVVLAVLRMFGQHVPNGKIDEIQDLATRTTVAVPMPDGTELMTDIYLPILSDCLTVDIEIPGVGIQPVELIPKGTQVFVYDSLNGGANSNPYQLPVIFVRTPYDKTGEDLGYFAPLLGYGFAIQDMRGRYESQGAYLPMYSDGWKKTPYHPEFSHVLDITEKADPRNGNNHEDGFFSLKYLTESLTRDYDLDRDGVPETTGLLTNGSIGMFGASALGNTQYQAAAARPIDPEKPGLKCMLPVVATNEHYGSTGFHNGVFRESLVTGWITGQLLDLRDEFINLDAGIGDTYHTSKDYGLTNKFEAVELAIDHFTSLRYDGAVSGYYPNSLVRKDLDASQAPLDDSGNGKEDGPLSRYVNMETPAYHVTGWWDIFINGQIDTWRQMRENLDPRLGNNKLQKLVIGPWAHQTIGTTRTGDMVYPENVQDLLGVNINEIDINNLDLGAFLRSEVVSWYRYNLNFNPNSHTGLPKALIPESNKFQDFGFVFARMPAMDYVLTYNEILSYLSGATELKQVPAEVVLLGDTSLIFTDLPTIENPIISQGNGLPIEASQFKDYTEVADVRLYVTGPVGDGIPENENAGNYWLETDDFPLTSGIEWQTGYFHSGGGFHSLPPTIFEGPRSYVHDPEDPVITTGGNNMLIRREGGGGDSQGQMDYTLKEVRAKTMERPDVLAYSSPVFGEPFTVIGYPEATLFASSEPMREGTLETDTDFFIRILDVYPDGKELFVIEGAVNARARAYAASVVEGQEDIDAPFANILSGEVYEFNFQLLPIAYTWGKGHKMKVLISSSNYPKYQSNPNIPIAYGDFFRKKPGDGKTYTYKGKELAPVPAIQRIYAAPRLDSRIHFPVFKGELPQGNGNIRAGDISLQLAPNPTSGSVLVSMTLPGPATLWVFSSDGRTLLKNSFDTYTQVDLEGVSEGIYFVKVVPEATGKPVMSKLWVR